MRLHCFSHQFPLFFEKSRLCKKLDLGILHSASRLRHKKDTGRTIYILDEPTTGLHFEDIRQLLAVLYRLVEKGNTVVVIEHNLDVIKMADFVVDVGPEGGMRGGNIICSGTPEAVSKVKESWTGDFLKRELKDTWRA